MSNETEVIIYCKIGDFEGLKQAFKKERYEQLESSFRPNNGAIKCRVRKKVTENNETDYTFTFKIDKKDQDLVASKEEYNTLVDEKFFNGFKQAAVKVTIKDRYFFNNSNIFALSEETKYKLKDGYETPYEVDVYEKSDGTFSEWCRIEVELDSILEKINKLNEDSDNIKINIKVSHLPFKPYNCILSTTQDPEQKKLLGEIWDTEFNRVVNER